MILLLLAVWGGVGIWWFMNRPESRAADSIGTFRQQLRVLERTGPTTVAPAFKMKTQDLGVFGARRVPTMSGPGNALAKSPSLTALRRRQTQKRRRDVFFGLLAGIGGSFILGFLPGLGLMWWLSVMLLLSVVVYVVALVQVGMATAERTQRRAEVRSKVRYLPAPVAHADARPVYALQRSAN